MTRNLNFCNKKPRNAYLVPPEDWVYGNWGVKTNWCGDCIPDFQKTRINMIQVREELLQKYEKIKI